jgi:predicted O-linked N-acetylglucosamine transferase (SPINDLY family)
MDYRLTDEIADPVGEPVVHSEKLVRLPHGFCCFLPHPDAPQIQPPPCQRAGHVTFGSVHHLAKLNDGVIDLWCAILNAIPNARLLIFRDALRGTAKDAIRQRFTDRGISPDRIILETPAGYAKSHLRVFEAFDILLDAFPYNGHTTICEALWMGVPAITLRGNRHAGRMAASVLTHVGLSELITNSPQEYLNLAVEWASDLDRLGRVRSTLREKMANSPLCNGSKVAGSIEEAYREMWNRWCLES